MTSPTYAKDNTMTTNSSPAVGKAVYLELVKGPMTTQVLFTPEGHNAAHTTVPMALYRRRISTVQPRKTWRFASSNKTYSAALAAASSPATTKLEAPALVLAFALNYISSLGAQDWKVRVAPIVVEATAEDLSDVQLGKTPYKLLGRVWKVRKKLGFPKEFVGTGTGI